MFETILIVLILIGFARAEPQLDGVHQHSTESPKGLRVVVLPNSYANDEHEEKENQPKSEANTHFDSDDRSQRYGSEIKKLLKLFLNEVP